MPGEGDPAWRRLFCRDQVIMSGVDYPALNILSCQVITWFQYMGNKQFGPFFGAEFDPNGHKNHEKYIFLKSK